MYGLATAEHHVLAQAVSVHNASVRKELRDELATMDPKAFEVLIGRLLNELGFEAVEVTKFSGDGGIDVRATLRVGGVTDVRTAVQVKRWANNVAGNTVRELRGGLEPHERGLVITLSDFTKDAKAEAAAANRSPVSLVDGERLIDLLIENEIGIRATPLTMLELDAAALVSEPTDETESAKVMAIWPMPGGNGQWRVSLDAMLEHVRSAGPTLNEMKTWILDAFPSVNSLKTATGYIQSVLRALELVEFNGGSVVLTAEGSAYLDAASDARLAQILRRRIAGIDELEALCGESPRSAEELASAVPAMIGATWATPTQIKARLRWLDELHVLHLDGSLAHDETHMSSAFVDFVFDWVEYQGSSQRPAMRVRIPRGRPEPSLHVHVRFLEARRPNRTPCQGRRTLHSGIVVVGIPRH